MNFLSYTEYKKQQALWLQREDHKRTDNGRNSDEFFIDCYVEYLKISGFNDDDVFQKIYHYRYRIETYYLGTGMFEADERYVKDIHDNIDRLMDAVL